MKDHNGYKRAFVWSAKAWYNRTEYRPEINFGMYDLDGGGASGEISMEWVTLGNRQVPRLKAFDDSWSALASFGDLLQRMGEVDDENITQEQFVEMLLSCGFVDKTEYKNKETSLRKELAELEERIKIIKSQLS